MRKTTLTFVAALLTAVLIAPNSWQQLRAEDEKPAPAPAPLNLKVGDTAPDFKLPYMDANGKKEVSLSDYRGKKNVVLAFYIFAFTGG
jgi:cytochrome oxidase Cu insertion factor (SCO1/SenC/PrrC family)